jgi:ABC-type transport system substrate-binding protein
VIGQAEKAGLDLRPLTCECGVLFAGDRPFRGFQMAEYPALGLTGPSVTNRFACDQIPTESNDFEGDNWIGWCNPEADTLMRASDREIDPTTRAHLLDQLYRLEVRDRIALPLYVVPVVAMWRTDKVTGPITKYISSPNGMFFNLSEWEPAG